MTRGAEEWPEHFPFRWNRKAFRRSSVLSHFAKTGEPVSTSDQVRGGRSPENAPAALLHPVAREFLGDVGLDRFRRRDIFGAGGGLVLQFRHPPPLERGGGLRIEPQSGVVIGDRGVEL